MGKEIVATRSSPRLKNKVGRQSYNSDHHKTSSEKNIVHASLVQDETSSLSSTTPHNVYLPQSLLFTEEETNNNQESDLAGQHPANLLRTTNNRRGGKLVTTLSKQSQRVGELKQRESEDKGQESNADKMKDFDIHANISVHTPSTAAAAAAAAAKALCDRTTRGRYDLGLSSRNYFEERQNVFRTRGDDYQSRITTKTRSDGVIRKPGIPFGNSTVRVMGSPTPTHISTRHYGPGANVQRPVVTENRCKSPSKSQCVFRKSEPGADGTRQSIAEASPQQLLMSLKSGSRSFELKSPGGNYSAVHRNHGQCDDDAKRSIIQPNAPLSPEAPPDIHHSHNQTSRADFFFHPRTPKTPKTPNIDFARSDNFHGTPSFSLFNQSFDSLVEASYLRSPNDQPLTVNFSLMDASPQKKSFMASPGSNFHGFSFSPTKHHTDALEDFVEGSPGITLDNCIVDAMDDAPLLPRTRKTSTDAFGSDVMILESSKSTRDVPTPTSSNQSPRTKSKDVPLKKRHNIFPLDRRSESFVQKAPSGPFDTSKRALEGPSLVRSCVNIQDRVHPVDRPISHPEHTPRTTIHSQQAYGQAILPPPHIYRSGPHPNFYQTNRQATTLVGLNLDQIQGRFASHKGAFSKCTYLLPGFQAIVGESKTKEFCSEEVVSSDVVKTVSPDRNDGNKDESEFKFTANVVIASRRVDSAICAFGGQVIKKSNSDDSKSYYSNAITNRYFEHESRISWDVEESPPVKSPQKINNKSKAVESPAKRVGDEFDMNPKTPKTSKMDDASASPESAIMADGEGADGGRGDAPRMKYRCKLCGKPKQNHICPYQKSLQRSIGISVYPAVNAFAASEPGNLAPALSDMNNFVREESLPEITPSRPKRLDTSIFRAQHPMAYRSAPHVTPENMRSMKSPSHYAYPESYNCSSHMVLSPMRNIRKRSILSPEKNSNRTQLCHLSDLVFIESTPLREEQFRTISSRNLGNFKYPCIPLPYSQRKTLSDNLFELSKELPTLKEDCAIVLRQAREDDMWDVAVAELLTQVIVAIHCPPEDTRLEGLSRFLNSLGFAC